MAGINFINESEYQPRLKFRNMETSKEQQMDTQEQELANQETGLSLELSGFIKLNKNDIKDKVTNNVTLVNDGYVDALDALILAKKIQEYGKQLEIKVRPLAEEKSYGKDYRKHDVEILEKMTGVSYDYSNSGDLEYEEMLTELANLKAKMAKKEAFLLSLEKPIEVVNKETGETYAIHPPIKKGRLGLNLTLK